MEGILNFNESLNVELLDKVVNSFYQGYGPEVQYNYLFTRIQFDKFLLIAKKCPKYLEPISRKPKRLAIS